MNGFERLNWIEIDAFGPNLEESLVLEAACVVTDAELNVLGIWNTVYGHPDEELARVETFATSDYEGVFNESRANWAGERHLLRDNGEQMIKLMEQHGSLGAPLAAWDTPPMIGYIFHHFDELKYGIAGGWPSIQLKDTFAWLESFGFATPQAPSDSERIGNSAAGNALLNIDTARMLREYFENGPRKVGN